MPPRSQDAHGLQDCKEETSERGSHADHGSFPSCQSFPAIDEESHILYLVDNSVENETNAMSGTRAAIARVIIVI